MSSSSASKAPPYTLYLYSPHPQSHQQLPVLDPAGLYIASLLRTLSGPPTATSSSSPSSSSSSSAAPLPTSLPFDIKAPSVYWHSTLPRLERYQPAGGVCVAEGVRDIEAFASARLAASAVRQAQEGGEDSQSWELKPLEAHLASLVEPLVYSVFFPPPARGVGGSMGRSSPDGPASAAQDVFDQITFPAYAQGLPFPLSRAIPHRLRERISAEVAAGSKLFRQLGSGSQQQQQKKKKREVASDPEMDRRRKEMAPLAFGSGRKGILGFGAGEKEEWKEEFWKQKMTSLGKQIFSPLLDFVPSSDSPSTTTKQQPLPRPLIHLYALLAPLLLSSPTLKIGKGSAPKSNPLSAHPLVHLLTTADEYEPLRRFVHRMHGEIWGVDETEVVAEAESKEEREVDRVYGDLTGWKTLYTPSSTSAGTVGEDVPTGARSSSSSNNSWRSYLPSFLRPSSASTSTSKKTPTPPTEPLSPLQQAALRRLRIGRAVWITSALLGTVGWLLVSGIVQVSFSEEEDEEDEEEEVEVIIEDTIGDGEGVQEGMDVVVLDGEDDEDEDDDDEEEEDEEEDEGVEWTFVRGSEHVDLDQPVEIVLGDDDDEDEL
ncbi:hypothetical protein BCV69DRAFT_313146 [Microstroma glucosiphilum]|uniref:Mitochondrial outer membrane transport complex Sam37/metaxin N-terminal domain-containing protein n=1 Tax=Pseudomicrostroma glucosiphilum TaxID=1684307 RepID=A0A316U3Z1_9BASI|nr:hypothetical protein BCV69DRAFT_313146 [Pseudomicrostroma glucosiphilum]PWN19937.1 hypothetical protein BCV69DRAFT_313146 [Pseudomicrostroma glucosiphilum]